MLQYNLPLSYLNKILTQNGLNIPAPNKLVTKIIISSFHTATVGIKLKDLS
jgi:hypothetical protein